MNRRPLALTLFAIAMVLVAISMPLQILILQDFDHLVQNLTWLNISVMILCTSLAWATLNAQWSVRLLLPLTVAAVIFNNWWVGFVALDFSMVQASFASVGFMALSGILLDKEALHVLRNPKVKWWDRSPRTHIVVPVVMSPWLRGPTLHKKSFDLSETGLFVEGSDFSHLKLGEKFQIRLKIEGMDEIQCTAKVVRKTEGSGVYPAGMGLTFENLGANEKQILKKVSQIPIESSDYH